MLLHKVIRKAEGGDIIEILATDPASTRDIPNFCRHLGHELLLSETIDKDTLKDTLEVSDNLTKELEEVANEVESEIAGESEHEAVRYDEVYRYLVKKKSL